MQMFMRVKADVVVFQALLDTIKKHFSDAVSKSGLESLIVD
jgi:hypothetical protein